LTGNGTGIATALERAARIATIARPPVAVVAGLGALEHTVAACKTVGADGLTTKSIFDLALGAATIATEHVAIIALLALAQRGVTTAGPRSARRTAGASARSTRFLRAVRIELESSRDPDWPFRVIRK